MRLSCRIRTCNQIPTLPRLLSPWSLTVGTRRLVPDLAENVPPARFPGARSLQGPPSTPMRLSCRIRTCNQIPALPRLLSPWSLTVGTRRLVPDLAENVSPARFPGARSLQGPPFTVTSAQLSSMFWR
jgi:hypothetical protein